MSDTAEYWEKNYSTKNLFIHLKGCNCGHKYIESVEYAPSVTCYSCLQIMKNNGIALTDKQLKKVNHPRNAKYLTPSTLTDKSR